MGNVLGSKLEWRRCHSVEKQMSQPAKSSLKIRANKRKAKRAARERSRRARANR
jgi:hypothetical protein